MTHRLLAALSWTLVAIGAIEWMLVWEEGWLILAGCAFTFWWLCLAD